MTEATAKLSNYRQSPRKVRMIAGLVRGKSVAQALNLLSFIPKRAALPVKNLIDSAVANAKVQSMSEDGLKIKEIKVDEGPTLYRRRPRSKGMANPIRKRTAHVSVVLSDTK